MYATLIVVAVLWGSATGLLLPRAAYRLSVEPEDDYRDGCEAGHPITGPARGWVGTAGCATCAAAGGPAPTATGTTTTNASVPDAHVSGAEGTRTDSVAAASAGRAEAGETALPRTGESAAPAGNAAGNAHAGAVGTAPGHDSTADEARPEPGPQAPTGDEPGAGPSVSGHVLRGARYAPSLLVPLVTAVVCALLAATTGPRPELAVWLLLTPFAVLLALVDRNVHRLPDELTLPLAAASAVLLGVTALLPGDGGTWSTALLGGLALGVCYVVLFLINPNGMGFGDVKLALALGVVLGWYGWTTLFVGAFAGFLLGSLYGLGLMALRRANRKSAIPFGPFMITGALLGLMLGGLTV